MKNLFWIVLILPLMATKCAQNTVNIEVINNSGNNLFITSSKNVNDVDKFSKSVSQDEVRVMKINEKKFSPLFLEASLNFYENKDKNGYVFYVIKQSDFKNRIYKFDSLRIPSNDIKIGNDGLTKIIINKEKIFYKTWKKTILF